MARRISDDVEKLEMHTWYLIERLVSLVLFSNLGVEIKEQVRHEIKNYNEEPHHEEQ